MAYFLFKCWHERLFRATFSEIIHVESKLSFELKPISKDNVWLVEKLRGKEYIDKFKQQLKLGDTGYYAWIGDKPVGYGWIKHAGSDDFFFMISERCIYLCRFYVHESFRGNRIYPSLINRLINSISDNKDQTYYIAAERGNEASENGLKRTGFSFVGEYGFIRGFKKTFNMKQLKHVD